MECYFSVFAKDPVEEIALRIKIIMKLVLLATQQFIQQITGKIEIISHAGLDLVANKFSSIRILLTVFARNL